MLRPATTIPTAISSNVRQSSRATLTIVPGFSGCRLVREVRYEYSPYCAEKHDRATF